ncbi:MAG: Mu-like prophage major head subunit gpT family protein, partial [Alphaproteobacteria bacterium]
MTTSTILTRSAGLTPASLNREARTVEVVALSGLAPVVRTDRPAPDGGPAPWIEELDASGADLSAFIGGPVLRDHRPSTDHHIGAIDRAQIEQGRIVATVRFGGKPAAEEIFTDVASGILRGVSLGYRVTTWQPAGMRNGRKVTVRTAPMPDGNAPTTSDPAADGNQSAAARSDIKAPGAAPGVAPAGHPDSVPQTRAATNMDIRSIARIAGLPSGFADDLIDRGATADEARSAAFAELARRSGGPLRTEAVRVDVVSSHDDPMQVRAAMAGALAARLAPGLVKPEGRAREFMGYRALDMAGELASSRGERLNRFNQDELLRRALGAHGTSDFPLLLQDAGNKILLAQYQMAAPTYRKWAARKSFTDFKAHKFLRVGDFPGYQKLAESGEVRYGTMSENREQVSADEYATGIIVGRKALINDDLSALSDFSQMIAVRTAADENTMAYAVLSANPVMADGKTLFHADHGNLATSGTAIDVANVGKARAAMRKQASLDGLKLNIEGAILVVGPDKEVEASQLVANITPTKAGDANPWAGRLDVQVDANVSGNELRVFAALTAAKTLVGLTRCWAFGTKLSRRQNGVAGGQ